MEQVSVSHFQATCLSLLEKVPPTGKPLLITKRGRPLAQIVSPQPGKRRKSWVGSMAGTVEIKDMRGRTFCYHILSGPCGIEGMGSDDRV